MHSQKGPDGQREIEVVNGKKVGDKCDRTKITTIKGEHHSVLREQTCNELSVDMHDHGISRRTCVQCTPLSILHRQLASSCLINTRKENTVRDEANHVSYITVRFAVPQLVDLEELLASWGQDGNWSCRHGVGDGIGGVTFKSLRQK